MKKLIFIITALVFAGLCLSCTKDNSINNGGGSGSGSGNSGSSSSTVSLSGTTWTTGEMSGEEQDATGTISGSSMNFKLSKNGSNYTFSKK